MIKLLRTQSAMEQTGPVFIGADHAQMETISSPFTCSTGVLSSKFQKKKRNRKNFQGTQNFKKFKRPLYSLRKQYFKI